MSGMHGARKTSEALFKMTTRLAQQVRSKTTSEHLLTQRDCGPVTEPCVKPPLRKKSQRQLAMENLCHMNFMPVPMGCWAEVYQARQNKHHRNLVIAGSAFAITIYCMFLADCFFLHSHPPRTSYAINKEKIGIIEL